MCIRDRISAFAALGAAAYGVATVLRMRSEESSGHLEQLLATPLTRTRFAGSYLVQAVLGSAVLVALLGATAATLHTTSPGGGGWWRVFSGALIGLPGIWLLTALAFVALAWLPRLDWLGWAFLGWVVVVDELGALDVYKRQYSDSALKDFSSGREPDLIRALGDVIGNRIDQVQFTSDQVRAVRKLAQDSPGLHNAMRGRSGACLLYTSRCV